MPVPKQRLSKDRMANLGRVLDILRLLIFHSVCSLKDRVDEHVHVLVDCAGDEEPLMLGVVRREVRSASSERNKQGCSTADDAHLEETARSSQSERPAASASRRNI